MVPMLKAARIGSSWKGVPGTLAPFGTVVPSTTGPSKLTQPGETRMPSRPQPRVSIKQSRAVRSEFGNGPHEKSELYEPVLYASFLSSKRDSPPCTYSAMS